MLSLLGVNRGKINVNPFGVCLGEGSTKSSVPRAKCLPSTQTLAA